MKPELAWPITITAWFLIVISSLVGFAFWSSFHKVDLVTEDYYEQELRHQDQIDREKRTRLLSAPPSIDYDAQQDQLIVTFAAATQVTGSVTMYRPADASLDASHDLDLSSDGGYVLDTASMAPGLWRVRLNWETGGQEYFTEKAIVLQ